MIQTWKKSLAGHYDNRIFSIFFFGFSSGLPFLLILSTLSIWLKEVGVNNTTIGLFVAVTIPYTFKFLWGPMVDRVKIPFVSGRLGQRRSWALLSQIALMFMLVGLGSSRPEDFIVETALWALGVAFFSAIQDIVIEAYRIEIIDEDQKGSAATAIVLGWRLGIMVSGAGALCLAATFSWQIAYSLMAVLMGVGLLTTLCSPSPPVRVPLSPSAQVPHQGLWQGVWLTYAIPLQKFLSVHNWRVVLALIVFYKVGDTAMNVMNTPFLVELGFNKFEIAHIAKVFGISAMIVGGMTGGLLLNRFGIFTCLLLCAALQFISSLMFVTQALVGCNLSLLVFTVGIENFTCGLGASAFIAYLSSLCMPPHTATHFALLSSVGSMVRIGLSIGAGALADALSWPLFFMITSAACLPFLFLLIRASDHFYYPRSFLKTAPHV